METYIQQLLSDLRRLHDAQPALEDARFVQPYVNDEPEDLRYVKAWEMTPPQRLEELFGIPAVAFPPPDQLTEEQMDALIDSILELWATWSVVATVPEGVAPVVAYRVLTDFWRDSELDWVPYGYIGLTLCGYQTDQCCWGTEHCICKHRLPRQKLTDDPKG